MISLHVFSVSENETDYKTGFIVSPLTIGAFYPNEAIVSSFCSVVERNMPDVPAIVPSHVISVFIEILRNNWNQKITVDIYNINSNRDFASNAMILDLNRQNLSKILIRLQFQLLLFYLNNNESNILPMMTSFRKG